MAACIRMPKMSDTMQHGIISRWLKQVGDAISAGDILAEVETDKAIMELESYEDGILLYIGVAEKAVVQVNAVIAIIGQTGEDISCFLKETAMDDRSIAPEAMPSPGVPTLPISCSDRPSPAVESAPACVAPIHVPGKISLNRVIISPLAKKIAHEKGYDIKQVQGSGWEGRIIKKDIMAFQRSTCHFTAQGPDALNEKEGHQDVPISAMRQKVAQVLRESKAVAPHFYLTVAINMSQVVALRSAFNAQAPTKISINDWMIKAISLALSAHPTINAAWLSDKIRLYQHVHIGVAVAAGEALVVPVIRFADKKGIVQISKEMKILTEQAQQEKLTTQDCIGATFTISNLGMLGIESFTAIINPPAACILAIGAVAQVPIVEDNKIVPAHMVKVTLSCDHRVVDGKVGALFLTMLKSLLEQPFRLLI